MLYALSRWLAAGGDLRRAVPSRAGQFGDQKSNAFWNAAAVAARQCVHVFSSAPMSLGSPQRTKAGERLTGAGKSLLKEIKISPLIRRANE